MGERTGEAIFIGFKSMFLSGMIAIWTVQLNYRHAFLYLHLYFTCQVVFVCVIYIGNINKFTINLVFSPLKTLLYYVIYLIQDRYHVFSDYIQYLCIIVHADQPDVKRTCLRSCSLCLLQSSKNRHQSSTHFRRIMF